MAAGRYNFIIEQGSTLSFEIRYKDSNGNPVDLTGYGARMQIRPSIESSTVYLNLSSSLNADGTGLNMSGSSGTKDPISGSIGLYISATTSSFLTFDTALYDLEIFSGSYVARLLGGSVQLSKEVTR
jgi:hypothetical protein